MTITTDYTEGFEDCQLRITTEGIERAIATAPYERASSYRPGDKDYRKGWLAAIDQASTEVKAGELHTGDVLDIGTVVRTEEEWDSSTSEWLTLVHVEDGTVLCFDPTDMVEVASREEFTGTVHAEPACDSHGSFF